MSRARIVPLAQMRRRQHINTNNQQPTTNNQQPTTNNNKPQTPL